MISTEASAPTAKISASAGTSHDRDGGSGGCGRGASFGSMRADGRAGAPVSTAGELRATGAGRFALVSTVADVYLIADGGGVGSVGASQIDSSGGGTASTFAIASSMLTCAVDSNPTPSSSPVRAA